MSAGSVHCSNDTRILSGQYSDYWTDAHERIEKLCPGVRAHLLQHLDLKASFTRLCEDEEKATKEAQLYKSIDDFLGEISKALVKYATSRGDTQLSFGREGRVEWVRHEQSSLRVDSMNADVRPDHATVMVASGEEAADVIAFWQQSPGVNKSKRKKKHGAGQQKTYAETHMMYRIDYPTVRGFMFDVVPTEGKPTHKTGRLRLTATNAQGFWMSPDATFDELDVWIVHVCETYEAHATRIRTTEPVREGDKVFYNFNMFDEQMIIASVFVKPPPGRTTFIGFVLDAVRNGSLDKEAQSKALEEAYTTLAPSRVIKESWLNPTHACHELQMYDAAHRDGKWNPGLARHECGQRLDGTEVAHPLNPTHKVFPEIIRLLSFGEPLSECETPRQLFEVIYDACLTLEDMYVAKVLHRDISGRNIMCRPVHRENKCDRVVPKGLRSINSVLCRDTEAYQCLVVDLDRAARTVGDGTGPYPEATTEATGFRERTGTPPFMAYDLLLVSQGSMDITTIIARLPSASLHFGHVSATPATVDGAAIDAFDRAFSRDAAEAHGYQASDHLDLYNADWFKKRLEDVHEYLDSSFSSRKDRPEKESTPHHQLRHDIESCFWVLYFYLARAVPASPRETDVTDTYSHFITTLLREDGVGNAKLSAAILPPMFVLHPDLTALAPAINDLRSYLLGTPWRYIEDPDFSVHLRLHPAHASVAMRRILLATLTNPKYQTVLDTALVTSYPRDPRIPNSEFHQQSHITRSGVGQRSIQPTSSGSQAPSGSQAAASTGSSNPNKRRYHSTSDSEQLPPSAKRQKQDPKVKPGSVLDLSQKIWKDLMWHSAGQLRQDNDSSVATSSAL